MAVVRAISDLANAIRGRRLDLRMSQEELAGRIGVSRKWVREMEAGNPGAQLRHVMAVLEVLGLSLSLSQVNTTADSVDAGAVDLDILLNDYQQE